MPRYFFHLLNGREHPDKEGTVLAGLEEARAQAVRTARAMLKDAGGSFWQTAKWQMSVTDEVGATVCLLRFQGTTTGRA